MEEPIRVLHVLQRMEAAGVQTLLMNMYRKIDRTKVQFDFLVHYTTPQFFDEEVQRLGGKVYRLSVREDFNFFKYIRELKEFFKEHSEYRVVHGHMHSLGAFYLRAAKRAGVPTRIAHAHTNSTQNDLKKYLKLFMNRMYAKYATELFACSKNAGEYMFPGQSFFVINNAIISENFIFDIEKRRTKQIELGIENKIVIGNVGRFEIQKNQKLVVEIFEELIKKHTDAVLLLIGTGSKLEEIKDIVKNKDLLDRVIFLGNRSDVAELYQAMDVFLMPSLFEGLGIVAVEAQASGTPVVCTSTLPEEINVTSLVYRIGLEEPVEEWVEKIELAMCDEKAHTNMQRNVIVANYDMNTLANKMQEYYISKYV